VSDLPFPEMTYRPSPVIHTVTVNGQRVALPPSFVRLMIVVNLRSIVLIVLIVLILGGWELIDLLLN
jgi:hypothetical protein